MTRKIALAASFSVLFSAGLWAGTANADDPKPCVTKDFKLKQVEAACKAGGQKAAKALMKKATKAAKAAGETEGMKCTSCHNTKDYKSDADGVARIKKWL